MKLFWQSVRMVLVFTLLLGGIYPLVLTLAAQGFFSSQANGSLIEARGKILGSSLIAQGFKEPRYFWPRPSAVDYNPLPSGGSNLSGTSAALKAKVAERAAAGASGELLYASASGLDPHISPAGALGQIDRVAAARALSGEAATRLRAIVSERTAPRFAGFLGEPSVNVLELNLAVDEAFRK